MRVKLVSGAVVLAVVLAWGLGAAIALQGTWSSLHRPDRRSVAGPPPTLERLNRAIASAETFVDGLYSPREDGTAVIAEYYGMPVRARFAGSRTWQLLGTAENRIEQVGSTVASELGLVTFRERDAAVSGWLTAHWDARRGRALIVFTPVSMVGASRVDLALQGRHLMTIRPDDVGRGGDVAVRIRDRHLFRSHRFTIRHATNDGEQYARYRGHHERARRLGAAARAGGFPRGRDIYAAVWDASRAWGDDLPFTAEAYADCRRPLRRDAYTYAYVSRTCGVPSRAYLWLSSFDPLARMLQGLHVLQRHGDPRRAYRDRDRLRVRLADEIGRWEALYRRQEGMPRCSPIGCDETWSSGVRTAVFGALETELGYVHGDRVSRSYADRVAGLVLRSQTTAPGNVRTAGGLRHQPLQVGGFAIAWRRGMVLGFSSRFVARKQDEAIAGLAMPREHVGFVASNAESAMAAYAFLVRYRCRRYRVGCVAQFAPRERRASSGRTAEAARAGRR